MLPGLARSELIWMTPLRFGKLFVIFKPGSTYSRSARTAEAKHDRAHDCNLRRGAVAGVQKVQAVAGQHMDNGWLVPFWRVCAGLSPDHDEHVSADHARFAIHGP